MLVAGCGGDSPASEPSQPATSATPSAAASDLRLNSAQQAAFNAGCFRLRLAQAAQEAGNARTGEISEDIRQAASRWDDMRPEAGGPFALSTDSLSSHVEALREAAEDRSIRTGVVSDELAFCRVNGFKSEL